MLWDLFRRYMYRIWSWIVWLFGAARTPSKISPVVYQVVSFILILVIGLLLAWFTPSLPFADNLSFNWDFVNSYFWGIVWFLLYIFVRLVLYVIELFRMEEASEFEDIDRAWLAGLREIAAKGLDLHNIPIFLVTGLRNVAEETAFLSGAGFHSIATGPDIDTPAPLRVFASSDAILVMATGVSTTSAQLNSGTSSAPGGGGGGFLGGGGAASPMASEATLKPGQAEAIPAGSAFGGDSNATLDPTRVSQAQAEKTQNVNPLSGPERDRCEARVAHLARLITRDRSPLCPINGLIAVVPLAWTQSSRPELHRAIQSDVAQLSWSLGLQFPVVCLASGLESLGSLNDLLSRCRTADSRFSPGTRAGARYPAGQPVSIQNATWAAGRSLVWFHQWVYACFAADCSTKGARTNGQLYRLWCSLSECRGSLATLLETGFGSSGLQTPIRLTGCYYTGFAQRQLVFVRDVLNRLAGAQDQVAWTPERIRKDASQRTWAMLIWLVVAALVLGNTALIYDRWFR